MTGPFVAVLTATGRGAVAVVRVWGDGAVDVADRAFRPNGKRRLIDSPVGRLRVGRVGAGLGDEVVAVVINGEVEVQCHGGPEPIRLVVEAMVEGGARLREPFAWARHSAGSRIKAEAMMALASATTLRSAEILMDQAAGALDEELRGLLELDPGTMLANLDTLIGRARIGERLVDGWRVVLAGRPNVGKSRLLNALAGYDRAIVAPTPGTTRDVVTFATALDGWPVELADTAGLRPTDDPVEAEGVARARAVQSSADLVIVVLDRSEPLTDADFAILHDYFPCLIVGNKADLPKGWTTLNSRHFGYEERARAGPMGGPLAREAIVVSAERGDGLDILIGAIADILVPQPPPPGSGVPFRRIHSRRLRAIRDRLASGGVERARISIRRWVGP